MRFRNALLSSASGRAVVHSKGEKGGTTGKGGGIEAAGWGNKEKRSKRGSFAEEGPYALEGLGDRHIKIACSPERQRQRRRGATAMEYLVVASFILMVLIVTIQTLGVNVSNLFKKDANATKSKGP
jgi:Flp pilus assembly pilin Flp